MAKTRMKTTPTRMQKDALIASAATTVTITKPSTITTTPYHSGVPLDEVKKRLRQASVLNKPIQQSGASTIIVTAPKRTNSISSVASSVSQTSDVHSDTESPPPQPMIPATSTKPLVTTKTTKPLPCANISTQEPRTLNNLLSKSTNEIAALRNRKVFMITEKSDEVCGSESSISTAGGAAPGQKRKMYLIMEENSSTEDEGQADDGLAAKDVNKKYLKRENGLIGSSTGSKKLTLFADKTVSGTLTEKFEKILPEILNRIKGKDVNGGKVGPNAATLMAPKMETTTRFTTTSKLESPLQKSLTTTSMPLPVTTMSSKLLNGSINLNIVKSEPIKSQQPSVQLNQNPTEVTSERIPITLPPKKNRTKIITTTLNSTLYNGNNNHNNNRNNIITVDNLNDNTSKTLSTNSNSHKMSAPSQIKQISAATPVIVSTATVAAARNNIQSSYTTSNEPRHFASVNSNASNNNNNTTNIKYSTNGKSAAVTTMAKVETVPRNINLSGDFHFLMEMLPKLESIPEPHKTNVKNLVEKIITQNANIFVKK